MKKKIKWKNILILIFTTICVIGIIIALFNIIKWRLDSDKTNKQISIVQEDVIINDVPDSENVEIINQEEPIPEFNPYWDFIKMSLIDVNFSELKNTNADTKGWIQVNGTNINYPFVQANDNSYYLTHTFDKSYNNAGWIFLDYRNNINGLDKNTIIYGHGRFDHTMFGSLKNILTSKWYNNSNNYVIKLSTETENTLWQVFSVYRIPTTSDYLTINFSNDIEYQNFLNMILNRSNFNFNTNVNTNDNIITLSTCYNNSDKVVMHAKLIKKEAK